MDVPTLEDMPDETSRLGDSSPGIYGARARYAGIRHSTRLFLWVRNSRIESQSRCPGTQGATNRTHHSPALVVPGSGLVKVSRG